MSDVFDTLDLLVAECAAHGIRATYDSRNVNPPCVLFVPPSITLDLNCGGTAQFTAIAIAPGAANADAWRMLDAMVDDLIANVLPDAETITPSSYGVDEASANPALAVGWTGTVNIPRKDTP